MKNRGLRQSKVFSRHLKRRTWDNRAKTEIERHFKEVVGLAIAKCREESVSNMVLVGSLNLCESLIPIWKDMGGPEIRKMITPEQTNIRRIHGISVCSIQSSQPMSATAVLLNIDTPDEELEIYEECRTRYPQALIFSLWGTPDQLNFRHELSVRALATGRRCLDAGASPVAVFGTGSHTRYLLKEWKGKGGPSVACILTSKEGSETAIEGIPVKHTDRFAPEEVRAIVLSSHSHETELYGLCSRKWPRTPIYTLWHSIEELQSSFDLEKLVQCVIFQCAADGVKRVVFFGAGVHTQNMLPVWRSLGGPEVVGIIVTNANGPETLADLRVTPIDSFDFGAADGIVLSSRAFEMEMAETCMNRWPLLPFYPIWNPALRLSVASLKYIIPNTIQRCRIQAVQSVALIGMSGLLGAAERWWQACGGPEVIERIKAVPSYDAVGVCVFHPEATKFNVAAIDAMVVLNGPDCAGLAKDVRGLWPEIMQILAWPVDAELDAARIPVEMVGTRFKSAMERDENEIAYQEWCSIQEPVAGRKRGAGHLKEKPQMKIDLFGAIGNSPSVYTREMLKSVIGQSYPHWELYLVTPAAKADMVAALVKEIADGDSRIHINVAKASQCVWSGLRTAYEDTSADFVIPIGQMDALSPDALLRVAEACREKSRWDVLVGAEGGFRTGCLEMKIPQRLDCSAFCDVQNYSFSLLAAFRRKQLDAIWSKKRNVGCFLELAIVMKKLLKTSRVHAIPGSLYFWRGVPGSRGITIHRGSKRSDTLSVSIVSRHMKVTLDARLLHRKTTGTERYISTILEGLAKFQEEANLEIRVLLRHRPKDFPRRAVAVLTDYGDSIRSADVFHKTIQAYDVEALKEMAGARACVYTIHDLISYIYGDYMPSDRAFQTYRTVARTGARLASHIITVSDHARQEIIRAFGIAESSITSVPNAIVPESGIRQRHRRVAKTQIGRALPKKYFLVAGTDYPHKNLHGLLRAYKSAKSKLKDIKIVSVGVKYYQKPQPELDAIKRSLGNDFIDLGFVTDEDLRWLYQHAVAFIFPSLNEGFGYPPLEAMQHGTPVAASNATSIPEVTGSAALHFDGNDPKSIARALVDIATDKKLRARLIRNGYARIRLFTLEKTITKTIESYFKGWQQSVEKRHSPAAGVPHAAASEHSQGTMLFVTHVPIWQPAAGNEIRLFNLIRYLKSRRYQIAVIFCPLDGKPVPESARVEIAKYVDHFYAISDDERRQAATKPSALYEELCNQQEAGIAKWLATEDTFCPKAVVLKTKDVLETLNPQVLVAEYIWMSRVLKLAGPGCLRIIDLHDKFSDKREKVNAFGIDDALAIMAEEETSFLSRCDIAIAIQDEEARAFRQMGVRPLVITSGVDFSAIPNSNPMWGNECVVLIVASDNPLNMKCIQAFIDNSWPIVRSSEKRARLRIIGGVCKSLSSVDRTIQLAGYRPDLEAEYASAHIVVNPVVAGTGLKIKSIEALSHGKPLVATEEAVEGISVRNGESCLVGHDWADLADKILTILGNRDLYRTMSNEAHLLAQHWFSADRVYSELVKCLLLFSRA